MELSNSNALKYLTFPKLQWITEYIKLLYHEPHSYKIYKAWIKVKTKYKDFCSLHSKYKCLTLYYSQVKLTVQKPRINHIVCQYFCCQLSFNIPWGKNVDRKKKRKQKKKKKKNLCFSSLSSFITAFIV